MATDCSWCFTTIHLVRIETPSRVSSEWRHDAPDEALKWGWHSITPLISAPLAATR